MARGRHAFSFAAPIRACLGAAAVAVAGCGEGGAEPPTTATLRVGTVAVVDSLPYHVMKEKAFAAREGLRFREVATLGGAENIEKMAAGTLDVGLTGVSPLAAAHRSGIVPDRVVAVGSLSKTSPRHRYVAVLARPEIRRWRDLAGRRVAVNTRSSLGGVGLLARMRLERERSPALIEGYDLTNTGLAVRTGDVAAGLMYEPFLTQSLLRGDGHVLGWVVGGAPMETVEATVIAVRAGLLRQRRELVKRYLRAHLAAVAWIRAHPREARQVLARALSLGAAVAQRVRIPLFARDARSDPEQMQRVVDVTRGVLGGAAVRSAALYDGRVLEAVLAERGR